MRTLSGLAPGEVYLARTLTRPAGGLLHHRFSLTTRVAVYSLLHFLAGFPGWELPTTLLCGARTFLVASAPRSSGQPIQIQGYLHNYILKRLKGER